MDDTTELFRVAYKHDFSGSYAPCNGAVRSSNTFSVGIFQWIPKASGKDLKKSAVKFRIKGNVSEADKIYKKAKEICKMIDERGVMPATKSMTA